MSNNCVICNRPLTRKQKKCCSRSHSAIYGNRMYRGENAKNWRGGKNISTEGYVRIHMPNHPNSSNSYVYEHRYQMEQYIGRLLEPSEVVHHINGDKTDNSIENLQLLPGHNVHWQIHNQQNVS